MLKTNFMKCLLCRDKDADQTGSHILTHSLVSNCTNEQGKKGRNKEMMFSISQSGERSLFVGNEVLPDKIAEIKGRELTDSEVESNKNDFVVDNIYCSDCEKLFGKIESEFSRKVLGNIRQNKVYEYSDNILIRLYFYIQIWRASSFKYTDWYLPYSLEEYLRTVIFEACNNYENGLSEDLEDNIKKIPLIINYLDTPADKSSSNQVFIPNEKNPYLLFLCDFVVEFFHVFGSIPELSTIANYNGINDGLQESDINCNEKVFKIRYISDSKREEIINSYAINEIVLLEIDRIKSRFVFEYRKEKRVLPTMFQVDDFMMKLLNWENVPLLEKLSEERISNEIKKYIGR